jgi:hypothetical protein
MVIHSRVVSAETGDRRRQTAGNWFCDMLNASMVELGLPGQLDLYRPRITSDLSGAYDLVLGFHEPCQ